MKNSGKQLDELVAWQAPPGIRYSSLVHSMPVIQTCVFQHDANLGDSEYIPRSYRL